MITVLGATGNVGSKIAAQLLAKGVHVRVVGRDAKKLSAQFGGAEVRAGDITDVSFLTEALKGSEAAFLMIPPDYAAASFAGHYQKVSEAIAAAVKNSGLKFAVNLSSLGAELAGGTGPIKYLGPHEKRLNEIAGLNVVHLRPAFFFENILANVPLIRAQSIMGSHTDAEVKAPMIATADIAAAAVKLLVNRDFEGDSVQELLGAEDLSMNEVTALIGKEISKPLKYVTFDGPSTAGALVAAGFSKDTAGLFVEMSDATNSKLIKGTRTAKSTTPTKFSDFAAIFKTLV